MAYRQDDGVFLEESFLLEIMPGISEEHIKIYIFAKGPFDLIEVNTSLN